jgi:hypothetical protein
MAISGQFIVTKTYALVAKNDATHNVFSGDNSYHNYTKFMAM